MSLRELKQLKLFEKNKSSFLKDFVNMYNLLNLVMYVNYCFKVEKRVKSF